ncbi:MAG: BlaI/MecI/CopY family transcriptional regulator [Bacteroidia bacterium]|nr:BlaI/MecI/CopY family transcriptional regulator [Bacteroidia bacterium]
MEKQLLTPLELKVMNILWALKKAFVKDLISHWPKEEKLPKYNTVSTIVRILEEKGYVGHESQGRSHEYYPLISKGQYQKRLIGNVLENVFSGSLTGMVSSLLDSQQLSQKELDQIKDLIEDNEDK